jgi:malate dehydrogenase (quinone)
MPLVMTRQYNPNNKWNGYMGAATYIESGTDVNFGALTKILLESLVKQKVTLKYNCKVKNISRLNEDWEVEYTDKNCKKQVINSRFVFIGAGGASLLLLEKTGIPESKGYGGFPISGQWLICKNKDIIAQHNAKVYGKASVGAPPMSVPHLDTRIINGEKQLLFGPYAGFSTKFLKNGSYWDLFKSIKISNFWAMLKAGINNIPLTKYLIKEVSASFDDKFNELLKYYPDAKKEDWVLQTAGQRVQVIKKDKKKGGILEFGTEVIASEDGTIAALLGASPGASTSVHIMLELIKKCFPHLIDIWEEKLSEMIPSYGKSLIDDKELYENIHEETTKTLKLNV